MPDSARAHSPKVHTGVAKRTGKGGHGSVKSSLMEIEAGGAAEVAVLKIARHANVVSLIDVFDSQARKDAARRTMRCVQELRRLPGAGGAVLGVELCQGGELLAVTRAGPMAEVRRRRAVAVSAVRAPIDRRRALALSLQSRARSILAQLVRGLAYLHDLGIVHRDLTLSNVMFDTADEVGLPARVRCCAVLLVPPSSLPPPSRPRDS